MDTKVSRCPEKLNDTTLCLSENCFCEVWPIPRAWFKAPLRLACKLACEQALLFVREKRDGRERASEDFSRYLPQMESLLAGHPQASFPFGVGVGRGGGGLEKSRKSCTQTHERRRKCNRRSLARVFPRGSLCSPQLESLLAGYVHVRLKEKKCLTSAT